ncbi:MAG: addiction module protein [Blastochloris sp.]|nr:addiction module protein [Blastochloris sp.]
MSKAEILAELPKLSSQDRFDILDQLWQLEESAGPTAIEKTVLDQAQADYESNPAAGQPWSEVQNRLRNRA